jgi:serine/threonine-protein kinase
MIQLSTLGGLRLTGGDPDRLTAVLNQPKRLALLAYLALARPRGLQSRDTILALFWPELDSRHARWALNQAIHYLRGALGQAALVSRGHNDIGLDPAQVRCDAVAFETACEAGRWSEALATYAGDLLPGLRPGGSQELDQWLEAQRDGLRHLAARAARARGEELNASADVAGAVECARQALRFAPDDETGVRRLIELLNAAGDRAGAARAYEDYASWLRGTLNVEPAAETRALIQALQVRDRPAEAPARPGWVGPLSARAIVAAAPAAALRQSRQGQARDRVRRASVVLGSLALLAAAILWTIVRHGGPAVSSLAVLPCTTAATDSLAPYRAAVMTEELTSAAGRSRLFEKVIAPQSVTPYRGTTKGPREISRELGVDALLYCAFEESGPAERLRVQLVDGRTSVLLWTDKLERDLALPGEASLPMLVVRALRDYAPAGRAARRAPEDRLPTHDLPALALYTEGRYQLARQTESAVRQGIYRFNEAIERDPHFALAYVGLARAYHTLGVAYGSMEPREAFPLMKAAAERALELDPAAAEAHALLAEYEMAVGWDWAGADDHLRQAIRLDPYAPWVLQRRAGFLTVFGRVDDARALDATAIDLSPLDPLTFTEAAVHRVLAGRPEEALPFVRRGLELGPNFPPILLVAGLLYVETGRLEQGIVYLRQADSLSGGQAILRGRLAYAYALAGDSGSARAILRELKRDAVGARPPAKAATAIALVHIGLGEVDSAFVWLEAAYRQRSGNLTHVLRTPAAWRLAGDSRYVELLRRVGLPAVHPSLEEFRERGRTAWESSEADTPVRGR